MKSWKSRKFIVFALSAALYVGNDLAGDVVDEKTLQQMIALIVGWLVAQGIADAGSVKLAEKAKAVADLAEETVAGVKESLEDEDSDDDEDKDEK